MGKKLIIKGAGFEQNAVERPVLNWVGGLTSPDAVGADNVLGYGQVVYFGADSVWNNKSGEYFKGKRIRKIRVWSRGSETSQHTTTIIVGYMSAELTFVPLTDALPLSHNSGKVTLTTLAEAESAFNEIDIDITIPTNRYLAVKSETLTHCKSTPLSHIHTLTAWDSANLQWVTYDVTLMVDFALAE